MSIYVILITNMLKYFKEGVIMIYPKFLKSGENIGICAPSNGVGNNIEKYELAIKNLQKEFNTLETDSVRSINTPSNTSLIRANEFNDLINNKNINMILCASGGDYLIDILPFINYENILKNPKWVMGYSDPTNLLYTITTNLDIATIYGHNASSFGQEKLHKSSENSLNIIKGKCITQKSFKYYEEKELEDTKYNLTKKVYWEKLNTDKCEFQGRIIGGCLDCIVNILGTKYDGTQKFLEKYKSDHIIWYFDIFSLSSENTYCTLWQMKELGYFKYTDLIIIGRIKYESQFSEYSYKDNLKRLFKNEIPIIFNADIGHVHPQMTIINGSIAKILCNNGKGEIEFTLK